MDFFEYQNGILHAEEVSLAEIAETFGTPTYVYSRATIERHWHAFDRALGKHPHLICYAVKANSNIAILNLLARLGSGFDIVSGGELERVLAAGGDPKKIVFSGVGKKKSEIQKALEVGIRCFNVESAPELERLNKIAGFLDKTAEVSVRVNPDVDAGTHPYISTGLKENKFGISINAADLIYKRAAELEHINPVGIDCHIGSQLTEITPLLDSLDRLLSLAEKLKGLDIHIKHLDLGGGLGIRYDQEQPPEPAEYADAIIKKLTGTDFEILMEPGRAIVGNAGVLLMEVEHLKKNGDKDFAIVDAAMNDNIRPALYSAWQAIIPVNKNLDRETLDYDIVGPVCESADFLGKSRALALAEGDLLAQRSAGAYCFTMSSNYNTRPRAAEVMIDGRDMHVINKREEVAELFSGESLLPE